MSTFHHSNFSLAISGISGLDWETITSDSDIGATDSLNDGDKVHDMGANPVINCALSKEDGSFVAKMTFAVTNADFNTVPADGVNLGNVYNIAKSGDDPATIGAITNVLNDGTVEEMSATAQTMCRVYTGSGETVGYDVITNSFTEDSMDTFTTDITGMVTGATGLAAHLATGTVEIYVKLDGENYKYYTTSACDVEISDGDSKIQKFILRMVQIDNDVNSSGLLAKITDVLDELGGVPDDFKVFDGHSIVVPCNVTTTEGFDTTPGSFGVRITFA